MQGTWTELDVQAAEFTHVCEAFGVWGRAREQKEGHAMSQGWRPTLPTLSCSREELLQILNMNLAFRPQ